MGNASSTPVYIDRTSLNPRVIPPWLDLIFGNLKSKVGYSSFSLQKSQNLKSLVTSYKSCLRTQSTPIHLCFETPKHLLSGVSAWELAASYQARMVTGDLLSENSGWPLACLPEAPLSKEPVIVCLFPSLGEAGVEFSLFPYFPLDAVFSLRYFHSLWGKLQVSEVTIKKELPGPCENSTESSSRVWKCVGDNDTEERNADLQGSRGMEKASSRLEMGREEHCL